ncbi:helix-turn-helix transcriptional regulator [Micromonospora aurantiaca (nom. illeg.)]|uniref:helix-turn-helix transcriptional regulator n=1 Tax=Micromonospora aurantiaca (nom. illeg.) TaxID=47850 RepID=UPI003F49D8A4
MAKTVAEAASVAVTRSPLATAEQVADYLGVPVATLYQWRYRNLGPRASKVGRHLRYRWADVESWVDDQAKADA